MKAQTAKKQPEPLGERVLVRRAQPAEEQGLIVIPDAAREKAGRGTVVATAVRQLEHGLRIDDEVIFSRYAGTEITVDGEELLVLNESDVLLRL